MTRHLQIDDLTRIAVPEQPALSPDGTRLVYALRTADAEADRNATALWQVGGRNGQARRLTQGAADSAPAWSPDCTHIAFLRAEDGPAFEGRAQVWLLPADGGEPERLSTLPLGAGAPVWSPDGTRLAFTAPVDLAADAGEDDATRAERASAPIVSERLDHRADGAGRIRTVRTHVHVLDVAAKEVRQVTEGDWHASAPAWSPDGAKLAFTAGTTPDGDLVPRVPVHVVDATDPKARPELVGLADGLGTTVTWTADGRALLVVGHDGPPVGHSGLLRVPLDGGEPVDLAASVDRNVMAGGPGYPGGTPVLVDEGRTVLFCVRDRGCTHLYAVGVDGGTPRPVLAAPGQSVSGISVAGELAATALTTPASFGELVTVDLGSGEQRTWTAHGAELDDVTPYGRVEREFAISDGTTVHGWLMRDPDATGPQPLLLDIHGGPHNAWNGAADAIHLYHHDLVARGWTVLLLNPRASDGYGEEFFTATRGAWGTADAKDFLEPLDRLVAEGIADADRLAVSGYSYGGFMTCYLTGRDRRFAAAVAGGVVADLTSMGGTSDAGHFLAAYELGATPWEGSGTYPGMDPYAQVDKVSTPTLILHGDADLRCPVGQAEQWHTALRERGVPSRLVLYPGASHLFILDGSPSHRLDYNRRIVDWLERYAGDASGPRPARIDAAHWQRRLATLAAKHKVPGAALGILRTGHGEDELVEAAYGVINKATGVEVSPETLFQIGSISKVWTATLVMQLVDEGLLDLDAPVAKALPELRLADADVTEQVTMRHLLTHTSGIDGDVFTDTGRGDDCLEKYVARLAEAAQNHPMGATWSYCNSGFTLAGRVIERLTGHSWDEALRERICAPLGLERTVTLPEEALLHRTSAGHLSEGDEEPRRAPIWQLPRSMGPAGLITATAADVLAFVRMHLSGGLAADGTRVLSAESAAMMTEKYADLPDKHTLGDSWGIGWIRMGWDGHRLFGHDGNTVGQSAFLRILPEAGLAVTLLTNGGVPRDLYEDLYREIFAELAGVAMPRPLGPAAGPVTVDISRHAGRYERASALIEVFESAGVPTMRTTSTGPLAHLMPDPVHEYELVPADSSGDLFVVRPPGQQSWTPVTFYTLPTGEKYVHFGVRATPLC